MVKTKKTILIVDDEPEMTEELKEILEDEGYKVAVAFDGVQAIKYFEKCGCKLVLLDIKMPKMNGVETYREMKRMNPAVPVIIVTGSFAKKNAEQALREGANDVVYKPFEVEGLLSKIKNLLDEPC